MPSSGLDLGTLVATFGADLSQLKLARVEFESLDRTAGSAMNNIKGGMASAMSQMASMVGVTLSVAGAVYAIEKAFRAGIRAVDDYRVTVVGIAATLTDMAKPGQGSMEQMFVRNKMAAQDMYKSITIEAAKHFSSAREGMMVYNRLVQSGYSARQEEVGALLTLTDKIKLATKGQNVEMQLNTEIIALMQGQARAQSMLAMELQSRLGPGWKDLVQKHRAAGDLLEWITSLYPGLTAANKEIEGTINAQWATTKSLLDLISIGGLAGAYDDIVDLNKQINEYLREHEQDLVVGIARGWATVRWTIERISGILDKMQTSTNIQVPDKAIKDMTAYEVMVKNLKKASETSINVVFTEPINQAETFWNGMNKGLREWGKAGDILLNQGMFGSLDTLRREWEDITTKWRYVSEHELAKPIKWMIETNLDAIGKTIQGIADFLKEPINWTINAIVNGLPSWMFGTGTVTSPGTPKTPPKLTYPDKSLAEAQRQAELKARGQYEVQLPYGGLTTLPYWAVPEKFGGMPAGGQTKSNIPNIPDKGNKGAEGAANRVQSMMETLDRELAKIYEGSMAESVSWANKMIGDLTRLQEKGADVSEAVPKVWQVALAKTQKLNDDFNKWYAGSIGDNYTKIKYEEEDRKKNFVMSQKTMEALAANTGKSMVNLVAENEQRKRQIEEVTNRQRTIEGINRQTEVMNLNKQYLDQMAQLAPTLDQQNTFRRASLELENQLSILAIEKLVKEKDWLKDKKDELLLHQALVNQMKRYNLEMEQNKGLEGWAWRRNQATEQRNTISDFLTSIEQGGASAFSQGFYATLANDKSGIQQMAQNLAKSFFEKIVQSNWTMLWDRLAKAFKPGDPMVSGAQQAGQVVVQAGQTFGQGVIESAYAFAGIVARAVPGSGGQGSNIPGLGGGGIPLPSSYVAGSSPGSIGGSGGEGGGGGGQFASQFSGSIQYFNETLGKFDKGNLTYIGAGQQNLQAGLTAGQAATLGMMSNMQLGLGAAGLGLGAIGLLTGSQGLVTAGMVLQTAAVAIQIAAMIMKATGFIPGAAHGAILGGTYTPIRSFATGAPRVSSPTLAWVGEGPNEEAVIPLQQGSVPVKLMGGREQAQPLVYAPTVNVGDGVSRDDKEWFKKELRRQKTEVYDMLRKGNRNFVRMK